MSPGRQAHAQKAATGLPSRSLDSACVQVLITLGYEHMCRGSRPTVSDAGGSGGGSNSGSRGVKSRQGGYEDCGKETGGHPFC